uniref:receptor protein-tyrosine kinase n=1 Tax=Graphocephala atropunctata TaxID=36148 RepID=A0A1B6LY24_9HEMI
MYGTVSVTACRAKMRLRITAVLLLLVLLLQVISSRADRTNERTRTPEERLRRHDSEEKTSGRRWTNSRNSPYQKIVSSYDRVPDLREASSEQVETSAAEVPDEAKAKSHKRKQWRTNASSHDQIPSEASSDGESQKAEPEKPTAEATDPRAPEVQRNKKLSGSTGRRRSASSHLREIAPELYVEISTPNPKKRRRPVTTTTLAPQTMSDSLYQYFRPLDQDVPQDDIIPFLDFGRKLSPVLPTPSGVNGANSIDNKSTVTKPRSRSHHEEKESTPSDEEVLQEDMDVTVVKKAIERNSVPRGRLHVREQGISDYYRKRVPAQIRTTENLVSTSDSSTASSVPGLKTVGLYKKNRHQIHPIKVQEEAHQRLLSESKNIPETKDVEIIPQKRRQFLSRPIQRSAALKLETPISPLTAESSLVKTIIKELPVQSTTERLSRDVITSTVTNTRTAEQNGTNDSELSSTYPNNSSSSLQLNPIINSTESKPNPKILSTAVVTSVSVEESLQEAKQHLVTESPVEETTTRNLTSSSNQTVVTTSENKNTTFLESPSKGFTQSRNPAKNITITNSSEPLTTTSKPLIVSKLTNVKNESSLRSREIYKPKAVPPGIPHLPRQIPIHIPQRNLTSKVNSVPNTTASVVNKTTTAPETTTLPTMTSTKEPSTTAQVSSTTTTTETSRLPTDTTPTNKITQLPIIVTQSPTPISTITPQDVTNGDGIQDGKVTGSRTANNSVVLNPTEESAILEEDTNLNTTQTFTTDIEAPSETEVIFDQPSEHVHEAEISPAEEPKVSVESESVPPPKIEVPTSAPAYPADEEEDQFSIYFTTLPASTVPVVDTRPEPEAAVVEEQKNATTPRPGTDWVKVGAVNKDVEVVYPETLGLGAYLLAGLGVVPIILGALIGARFIMAHNKKKVLDESEYSSEYNRSPLGVSSVSPLPTKLPRIPTHVTWSGGGGGGGSGSETEKNAINPVTSSSLSASNRWEFPREKLRLQTLLGQGNFGQVWKAEADDISGHEGLTRLVAVKTVKESANAREREDLLRELGIMQELGSHPNVVTLLGCCTEKEPIYLVMEYVMYGKMLSFLRDHRTRAHYYNFSDAGDALTSRDLTVFGYCVARGMDYLSNKSIIHRDLAARNVLVDHNKLCKIADFGMSRNVRDTGQIYEQRQSKGALPIRWMAPESLHFSLFTHKTDVWSFGILMWEIVTLGSTPYANMGAREVMRRVRDGYRLDRPSHCRPELFRLIAQCWNSEPVKRPSFPELKVELGQLLSDSELNGSYVDLDSFADEMRRDTLHRHH